MIRIDKKDSTGFQDFSLKHEAEEWTNSQFRVTKTDCKLHIETNATQRDYLVYHLASVVHEKKENLLVFIQFVV